MSESYNEPEDFLSDESFLAWYFKTGQKGGADWDGWMAAHPDRPSQVKQAVELLDTTRLLEKKLPADHLNLAEASLLAKIEALPAPSTVKKLPLYRDRRWMIAASILVVLGTGLLLTRFYNKARPEIKAGYGEISRQQLTDGTEVTLNANSRLSYSSHWKDGKDREVWLYGEAFFHVQKTALRSRFIVHTDHFDVVVTGTHFNVVNRHDKNNVLLEEGSVILHTGDGKELNMKPGDFVDFHSNQLEKRIAPHDSVVAWKEQKLVFDKTPMKELARIIEDHYGVPVKLADEATGNKTISAILPNNNLDILLKSLEATSEFDVTRQDSGIFIRAHSE
jgi:transmembrane sensor